MVSDPTIDDSRSSWRTIAVLVVVVAVVAAVLADPAGVVTSLLPLLLMIAAVSWIAAKIPGSRAIGALTVGFAGLLLAGAAGGRRSPTRITLRVERLNGDTRRLAFRHPDPSVVDFGDQVRLWVPFRSARTALLLENLTTSELHTSATLVRALGGVALLLAGVVLLW